MDSFTEFAIKDTHDHPDFNKMYSCFISYVGRQRSNGVTGATSKPDIERCRAEYADILLQGSISVTRKTVSAVVNKSIQIHGAQIMSGVEETARSRPRTVDEPETTETSTVASDHNSRIDGEPTSTTSLQTAPILSTVSSTSSTSPRMSKIPRPCGLSLAKASATNKRKYSVIQEPWRSLLQQLLEKIKGGDVACAEEWPLTLTGIHLKLYKFIERQLHDPLPMSKVAEKDVLVAMSGIVNTRMDQARQVFGEETVNQIKTLCLRPSISDPNQKLREVLVPLQAAYNLGGLEELLNEVEEGLGVEAKARRERTPRDPLRGRILDAVRHVVIKKPSKNMSEAELVEVWSYIMNALAGHKLTLRSGELASKATRWQRMLLQQELNHDSGSATYGRKLDLQCRSEELELNNSEFKVDGRSKEQIELHVFVSDLATKHLLRLPDSTASWKQFLSGSTLSVLLAYVEHLTDLVERIDEQGLLHEQQERIEDRRTPEREPRTLGEFTLFSPSKKRCLDVYHSSIRALQMHEDGDNEEFGGELADFLDDN
ncbi:hypothetical protein BGW38_005295 [Lunasporangiospora selenospora]|uniref:Uncharacterized protein n=1 Tax=Lunasporangiospora selenospora TaxID=979761 RepID=A0A9P6KAZ4_9FUNG|nr:hypothetical protein BGW38_005295 [Lunasporangiospora selenospora]